MEIEDRVIVVTGGGSGIGRAMAERFARDRPRGIVVVDQDAEAAQAVAHRTGGLAVTADVTRESEVRRAIDEAEARFGPIDLYCSNAGTVRPPGDVDVSDEGWQTHWNLHVMAHVWAARALLPRMTLRGEGYLLITASAAGLVMLPGAAPYTVTKHAAVALAESLAVVHRGSGVRFSCLCPAYVETPMSANPSQDAVGRALQASASPVQPEEVADIVVQGLRDERFLFLTHPRSAEAAVLRAGDPEAFLDAMSGLWAAANETSG